MKQCKFSPDFHTYVLTHITIDYGMNLDRQQLFVSVTFYHEVNTKVVRAWPNQTDPFRCPLISPYSITKELYNYIIEHRHEWLAWYVCMHKAQEKAKFIAASKEVHYSVIPKLQYKDTNMIVLQILPTTTIQADQIKVWIFIQILYVYILPVCSSFSWCLSVFFWIPPPVVTTHASFH